MGLPATFTLSLDCEGLWGMADQRSLVCSGKINDAALGMAYEFIRCTMAESGVRATAAFVSCFAAELDALKQQMRLLESLATHSPNWFAQIMPALRSGQLNGWNGSKYFRALKLAGHEMAWHGSTHMPLIEQTPTDAVELEIQLAQALMADLGQTPGAIVFPRNQVGHLKQLRVANFDTYRASPPSSLPDRLGSLVNEWNVFDSRVNDRPVLRGGWHVSPSGYFLNWPSGLRAMVPVGVTIQRWKSLLRNAVEQGGYVHMWFHPHNLITAPAMQGAFEQIMKEVGQLVRSGDIVNLTMSEANAHFAHC